MRQTRSRRRWLIGIGALVMAPLVGWIGVLAFPQVVCHHQVRAGVIRLYYDDMPEAAARALAQAVDHRLRASGFADSAKTVRAFLFQRPAAYGWITRLSGVPREAQGFNLSLIGNTFVSGPRVAALGEQSGRRPRYSVWEGDPAHTIAHEVGHQYVVDRIGRRALPQWKREGLAEYMANIGLIRADSTAGLVSRLGVFDDDQAWSATRGSARNGWDRIHYEAGLLVEFLMDVRGHTLTDIAADSVTQEGTRTALRAWAEPR
ncbi:MAG: hypothetical protein OEY20_16990 [Gemmatimonadota bacterium]|nr:hypothetical protein [Gemmatimonadota bacterium]MDH5198940.1 hypothetical protein [Gemmatimonadota bacterium]